jgi:hypothetical protein
MTISVWSRAVLGMGILIIFQTSTYIKNGEKENVQITKELPY